MNETTTTANLTTATQVLEKEIAENAELIMKLQRITEKIGLIPEMETSATLQKSPDTNGEYLIAKAYDNIRRLTELNNTFHHIITNLERIV